MVLCRFHIEQQMLIIHIFSTNPHMITLLRFQVNLQKAENTLTVRHCTLSASCMLSAITFDVQIDAETDCDLLLLPAVPFSRLMKNNIYLENFIYKRTTEHFSDVIAGIERTFFMTLTQRIAAFLLDEAADTGSDELALTQEAIARSIGSAREAVSRSLKKMNKDGSIQISRGSIRILDKRRLYEMMNTF